MENTLKQNIQPLQKDYSISLIRLISILFIVLCHFFQYFDHFLAWHFNIGVQLFLIISGFLWGGVERYKNFDTARWWKSTKKIMLDYSIVCVFIFLLHKIFTVENLKIYDLLNMIFGFYRLSGSEHLWFIPFILFCYLITPFLAFFKTHIEKYVSAIRLILKVLLMNIISVVIVFVFPYFNFVWILCYLFGFLFAEQIKNIKKSFWVNIFPTLIVAIGLRLIVALVEPTSNLYWFLSYYTYNSLDSLARFFTSISLFLTLYYLFSFIPFKNNIKILNFSDKYSYTLYLTHQVLIFEPLSCMTLTASIPLNIFLTLLFISIFSIVVAVVSNTIKFGVEKTKALNKFILK